jgi:L-ribulose-5-phosphate 4-epimerase
MLESLKEEVCRANRELQRSGLVTLTWGNTSGLDRQRGLLVIKPSGVPYDELQPEQMIVVDLDGNVREGTLRPSSDTPTHICLYRRFGRIGGITHTHSRYATAFAQARREIPCLGTTHADQFNGPVPVTRQLTEGEVSGGYERATGEVIVERFRTLDPAAMPAVLVAGHAPFTWGATPADSVQVAVALEAVAEMAVISWRITPQSCALEPYLCQKHFLRKHGPAAYYGQAPPDEHK